MAADGAVAVPVINPVELLNDRPAGKAGDIEYPLIAPPVDRTLYPLKAVPMTAVPALEDNVNPAPATWTVNAKLAVAEPVALVAVIV
jgi:hypothetical protein